MEETSMSGKEKTIMWCDKIMVFSFYALIYFLPISIALSETFTGIALFCYLLKRWMGYLINSKGRELGWFAPSFSGNRMWFFLKSFKPIDNCLNVPIAVFLIINLISAILSQRPSVSWAGFFGKTLQSAFIYFNFIECFNSRKRLKTFLNVFFVSATLICVNGIYQSYIGQGFILGHFYGGRLSSSLRHPNDFGAYLVIVIPILLSVIYGALNQRCNLVKHLSPDSTKPAFLSPRDVVLSSILFLITTISLGLTYSRGAWIGYVFAVAFLGISKRKIFLINCVIILLFFNVFYPKLQEFRRVNLTQDVMVVHEEPEAVKESLAPEEAALEEESLSIDTGTSLQVGKTFDTKKKKIKKHIDAGAITEMAVDKPVKYTLAQRMVNLFLRFGGSGRSGYWKEAISMIKDYPVWGVGINAYSLVAPRYKISWGGYPHNCYLQMAVEIGVIGLISFLWIVFNIFREGLKNFRRGEDAHLQFIQLGVLSSYAGFLAHSFFDTLFYSVQLGSLQWIIMGLIIAVKNIENGNGEKSAESIRCKLKIKLPHVRKIMVWIYAIIFACFALVFCYTKRVTKNPRYGPIFYHVGLQCQNCPFERRLGYFQKAIYHDPTLSRAYNQIGNLYREIGDEEEAFKFYLKASRIDHTSMDAYVNVGLYYYNKGKLDYSLKYFKQASHLNISDGITNYYLGLIYELKKDYYMAITYYQKIHKFHKKYFEPAKAREGVLHHLVKNRAAAVNTVEDLRSLGRNDLADQVEHFIESNQVPKFMYGENKHLMYTE